MTELRRITVAGAGAIGSLLSARLAADGHAVNLLTRGAALDAVRARGLVLHDLSGELQCRVRAEDAPVFGVQDVLFLCVKSHDLPALAETVQPLIGPATLIVPLCNGVPFWYFHGEGGRFAGQTVAAVDPAGTLGTLLPLDQVIGAVTFITAEVTSPGEVVSGTKHLVMFGEPGRGISDRLRAICNLVGSAGIEARPLERIRDKLWTKLIANLTSNPLSVISGATLGEIYSRPDLVATVREVLHESMLAAACHGARLEIDPIEFLKLGAEMGTVRTSMLQDFERGRPLELGAIGDAVIELADRYALPMRSTRTLLDRVRSAGAATHGRPKTGPR